MHSKASRDLQLNCIVCTHHKAGSTWIRSVMRRLCDRRGYNWRVEPTSPAKINQSVDRGSNVTITTIREGRFENFAQIADNNTRAIRVIRDPRDALVSQYFSWRNSHKYNSQEIVQVRKVLRGLSPREGMLWLIDNDKLMLSRQFRAWPVSEHDRVKHVRYEDMLVDFNATIFDILEYFRLPVHEDEIEIIRNETSFESVTGRQRGDVRVNRHLRKGVAGDWLNHFDHEITARFDLVYGELVEELGYERHVEPTLANTAAESYGTPNLSRTSRLFRIFRRPF